MRTWRILMWDLKKSHRRTHDVVAVDRCGAMSRDRVTTPNS